MLVPGFEIIASAYLTFLSFILTNRCCDVMYCYHGHVDVKTGHFIPDQRVTKLPYHVHSKQIVLETALLDELDLHM